MVFAGTCKGAIFGLRFFKNETLKSAGYQDLVREQCIPELKALNGDTLDGTYLYNFFKEKLVYIFLNLTICGWELSFIS